MPALWALVHGGAARRWVALLGHDAGYAPAQVAAAAALGATPSTLPTLITAVEAANQSLR